VRGKAAAPPVLRHSQWNQHSPVHRHTARPTRRADRQSYGCLLCWFVPEVTVDCSRSEGQAEAKEAAAQRFLFLPVFAAFANRRGFSHAAERIRANQLQKSMYIGYIFMWARFRVRFPLVPRAKWCFVVFSKVRRLKPQRLSLSFGPPHTAQPQHSAQRGGEETTRIHARWSTVAAFAVRRGCCGALTAAPRLWP
jgi:hypothetical protein